MCNLIIAKLVVKFIRQWLVDAPPNSLKDLNVNFKMKIMEEKIRVYFFAHNISRVKGVCWSFKMGIKTNDEWINYSYRYTQSKQQVG